MKQTIITRHKVGDYDTWIKGHQDRMDIFSSAIAGMKTFQDADDSNSVLLMIEVTDMDKFQ